jgi:WD40 repeat protein
MFSWDGRSLAVETPNNQVEVWDVAHRKVLRTITASHGGDLAGAFKRLRAFAFSGDGKRLAAAFYSPAPDGEEYPFSLAVWDTATGRLISKEKATPDAISLASDGKQRLRVLDSLAGTTRILEPDAKDWSSPQRIVGLPPTDSRAVTLSDDGARAYLDRGPDEKDELWDLAKGKRLSTYDSDVRDAPVMPANDSNRLLKAADQAVVAYDTAAGRQRMLGSFSFPVSALAASGDGMWVAAGSSDGAVSLLSTSSFQAGTTLPNLQQVRATELTADKRLAFRSGSAGTDLWTVTEKGIQRIGHIDLHMVNKPTRRDDLIASADGTSALVTQEGTASLWNPRSGTQLNSPRQFGSDFRPLTFLPDNQHILALKDNALQVLDPRSWQVQDTVPVESGSTAVTAVSTDRRTVAVLESGELSVWRYRGGQGLKRVRTATVEGAVTFDKSLAVSPHGEKVAIVNEDKRLFVVDVASGRIARSTTAPAAAEMAAVFSSDSALLVQAFGTGDDAGLQFWDTATGEARGTWSYKGLSSRAASAPNVLTGPDGSILAFRPDGSLVRHTVSITAWHEVLCRLVPGKLPDAEYDRYLEGMDVAAPCRTPAE